MTEQTDLDAVMRKIESALRMADHAGSNENEAAIALSLAQKLADAHNIDIAMARVQSQKDFKVGAGKAGPREDNLFNGGLYPYQRSLFEAVAKLNHCLYWAKKGLRKGEKYQHRLVGSKVNIMLTRQMADYLQKTVERLARDFVGNDPKQYFTKSAHSFREGAVDRIIETITTERKRREAEDKARAEQEAARRSHPAYAGSGALIVLDDIRRAEEEANYDFQYGEGAWARREAYRAQLRKEYAERAAARKKADEEYAAWAAANPEEHARKQAEAAAENAKFWADLAKKEARKARNRRVPVYREPRSRMDRLDQSAYYAGSDSARSVRLDPQVERTETKKLS